MKTTFLSAAAFAALVSQTCATVLLNEPFSAADYTAGTFKSQMNNVATNGNVGFAYDRKWNAGNTGVVFVHDEGLDFGRKMPDFHGTGLSAGWNYAATGNGDGSRGVFRRVADGVILRSGTYFFRCLAREAAGTKWLGEWHRRVGFQETGFDGDGGFSRYWTEIPSTGPQFLFQCKDTDTSVLKFHFHNLDKTLVDPVVQGTTYLCLAKVEIGVGPNGTDLASALAVPVDDWDWSGRGEPTWAFTGGETGWKLATTQYYGDKFQLYGAYKTGSVSVTFDEVMLATTVRDCVGPSLKGTVIIVK